MKILEGLKIKADLFIETKNTCIPNKKNLL